MKTKLFIFLFTLLMFPNIYGQFSFDPCVVAYYPYTGNANDMSGNSFFGIVNGPTLANDRFSNPNSAYSFDGVNDYISANIAFKAFSISYWINTSNTGIQTVLTTGNGGTPYSQYGLLASITNGEPKLFFASASVSWGSPGSFYIESGQTVNDGNWHHVVFSIDTTSSANCKTYIDGSLSASTSFGDITTIDLSILQNSVYWFGLEHDMQAPFQGVLDEVRLFNCELDTTAVQELFTGLPSSIDEQFTDNNFNVYPNPAHDYIMITTKNNEKQTAYMYNMLGELINTYTISGNLQINISSLSSGIYIIKIGGYSHKITIE